MAQRSRSRNQNKKEKVTVEQLVSSYRFSEAVEQLEEKISYAERRRKPTEDLENQLERVRSLQVMLSATEKVKFVDSLVVDKATFLAAYNLGSDCGRIAAPKTLLPENLATLEGLGNVAYCNELNDMIYFPIQKDSTTATLHFTARIGDTWSKPKPLKGLTEGNVIQDFPYVLSDGVTMYYAEINEEGLGGYDIYVTRYNADTGTYLKPENIGMPFNSMANDYLYAIDEINNLGWFATDRNQPEGKVCIYIFQPNVTREVYNTMAVGEEGMRRLAMIHSINESRLNKYFLDKARERLEKVKSAPASRNYGEQMRYVINDNKVYTSLLDFKSDEAQRIAMELGKETKRLETMERELGFLRSQYQKDHVTANDKLKMLEMESAIYNLRERIKILEKNMRKAELK